MSWRVSGSYLENCNCKVACSCTVSAFTAPTTSGEGCHALFGFHIESGEVDGVDVSGLTVAVVIADSPRLMIEGGWRIGMFMDERASAEQAEKLAGVFGGQRGGPMGALAPLVGEFVGSEPARMEYSADGRRRRLKIGDNAEIDVEEIQSPLDPSAPAPKISGVPHPANSELTVARGRSRISALGVNFSNDATSAFTTQFSWSG